MEGVVSKTRWRKLSVRVVGNGKGNMDERENKYWMGDKAMPSNIASLEPPNSLIDHS